MKIWNVMKNPVNDSFIFQVYKLKNQNDPMHSGNIETTGKIYSNEEDAQLAANEMNLDMTIAKVTASMCYDYCKFYDLITDDKTDDKVQTDHCSKCPLKELDELHDEIGRWE